MTWNETQPAGSAGPANNTQSPSGKPGFLAKLLSVFVFDASADPEPLPPLTNDDLAKQDHINFIQNLNEVQMLLDHISGNPTKNLTLLNNRIVDSDNPTKTLKDFEIVTEISEIGLQYTKSLSSNQLSGGIDPKKAAFFDHR